MRRDLIRDQFGEKILVSTRDFKVIASMWVSAVALVLAISVAIRLG